jgi:hypothetical protein
MDEKRRQKLLFKAGAFAAGALLNYAYLLLIGKTDFGNLVFLLFFAALFALAAMELVSYFGLLGLKLRRVHWFFTEVESRETTAVAPQSIYLPLGFCAVILWFQYALT